MDKKPFDRILIVSPFGIGDVLFTMPLVAALKARYPSAVISYLGNARTAPFLAHDPRLNKVFSYERDEFIAVYRRSPVAFFLKWHAFVREIRAEKFDVAFDLSMGSPLGVALLLAGIPQRIGFDHKGRGRWLTTRVPFKGYEGRHVADHCLDLIGEAGRTGRPWRMALACSAADAAFADRFLREKGLQQGKFIALFPGGGASWGSDAGNKRWPTEHFAELADKIIEKGFGPIILMGDKSEVPLCDAVLRGMSLPAVNAAGVMTLSQAAALVVCSRFVIVNDGGPLHIAVAAGARTVSIFGPVDPVVYGPYPSEGHKVIVKGLACQPCYRNFRMTDCTHRSCLTRLTADEVFEQIKDWL